MRWSVFSLLGGISLVWLVPACDGGGGSGGSGGSTETTGSGGTTGSFKGVTVLFVDDYELDGVTAQRPQDMSQIESVTAFVKNGDKYDTYPGKLFDDGHAEIADVPEGPYLLQIKPAPAADPQFPAPVRYRASSARTLDLGAVQIGRADVVPLDEPASLHVTGALSEPWAVPEFDANGNPTSNASDRLELYSREAGAYGFAQEDPNSLAPQGGDTSVDWTFDAQLGQSYGWTPVKIDASKGDKSVVVRQRNDSLFPDPAQAPDVGWATATFDRVVDAQATSSFTLSPDAEAVAQGGFTPSGSPFSYTLDYKQSAAAPFSDALGAPTSTRFFVTVFVEPGKTVPSASASPLLLNLTVLGGGAPKNPACYPDDMGMCDAGACPNGCDDSLLPATLSDFNHTFQDTNPFNADASLFVDQSMFFVRRVMNPGDGKTAQVLTVYDTADKVDVVSGEPFTPKVGLIQNPKAGGKACDFDDVVSGVGTGPTLSWDAPATGQPQDYYVQVRDENDIVDAQGNTLSPFWQVAQARTADTQITFPEGTLTTGHYYTFRVYAIQDDVARDPAAPYRPKGFGSAFSMRSTGLVTP